MSDAAKRSRRIRANGENATSVRQQIARNVSSWRKISRERRERQRDAFDDPAVFDKSCESDPAGRCDDFLTLE